MAAVPTTLAGRHVVGTGSRRSLRSRVDAAPGGDQAVAWRHIDWLLVGATLAIAVYGVLMVFSATKTQQLQHGASPTYYLEKQGLFMLLGTGAGFLAAAIDYRRIRPLAVLVYIATIALLAGVKVPGLASNHKGAQSWYDIGTFQLQPSEFAKLSLLVCLAAYASKHRGDLDGRRLLALLGMAGLPMALIQLQPDLGTNLVFAMMLLAVLLIAGVRGRHMAVLAVVGIVGIGVVLAPGSGILGKYQKDRLGAFVDSSSDIQGSRYNLNQSKIAIGSGGVAGKGLFEGTQTRLALVPEQRTDFIFTAVGEQLGLIGSVALLALFGIVVWRTWRAASLAQDLFGTLLCIGILAMFVFQIFENVGMTMGIMPITGIPLPFMSYGGSATIVEFVAIGVVLNVNMRRFA